MCMWYFAHAEVVPPAAVRAQIKRKNAMCIRYLLLAQAEVAAQVNVSCTNQEIECTHMGK